MLGRGCATLKGDCATLASQHKDKLRAARDKRQEEVEGEEAHAVESERRWAEILARMNGPPGCVEEMARLPGRSATSTTC